MMLNNHNGVSKILINFRFLCHFFSSKLNGSTVLIVWESTFTSAANTCSQFLICISALWLCSPLIRFVKRFMFVFYWQFLIIRFLFLIELSQRTLGNSRRRDSDAELVFRFGESESLARVHRQQQLQVNISNNRYMTVKTETVKKP